MIEILKLQYDDNFVGREEETKELKEKIEKNGIVVITGGRGIGKTNLIKVVEKDFENQKECHHIEYGSLFSSEVSRIFLPDKILTGASGGFIVSGGISWKPREPSVLEYMEKSEEKMIFVENAHELKKEEIETIFVASRRNERLRFVLEVATPYKPDVKLRAGSYEVVELEKLSDKSMEKIVRRECPNFSDAIVRRIISLSKGYPYVARSLAYICDGKNVENEMFEFLKTLRDDDMEYNLDRIHKDVLNTLKEDSQGVIKRLAIAPATLNLNLIEAFCGERVDTSLNDIIERGILVKLGEKSYRIYHPLFREYLRNIQPIAIKNKKELYCEAMEKVKSEFDSIFILFEVLNEPDIFEELIKQTENYEAINSVGAQTYTWGKLGQALCAWNHLLQKARGVDKEWEVNATGNISNVYRAKGELEKALEYFEKALKLDEEFGIKEGMAAGLGNIGMIYPVKGEFEKALEYLGKALKRDKELGDKEGIARDLGNIGSVYLSKGEFYKALEYYEKALKLDEELGRKEGIAASYGNIGIVYRIKGELDKALGYLGKALRLDEELGIKEGMAISLEHIGNVYRTKRELDKVLEYYKKALGIFQEMGSRIEAARTLMNIGDVFYPKGKKERALDYYLEAQDLILDHDYPLFEDISKRINILLGAD